MDIVCGKYISAATEAQIILGWIPDYFMLNTDVTQNTETMKYIWQKSIADAGLTGQYGFFDSGTGDWVACASGSGITALTLEGMYANIESPIPGRGKEKRPIVTWSDSLGVTPRSATVIGTIIVPTKHNGFCYEVTVGATTAAAEPTAWSTVEGELSAIDNDVYYRTRYLETVRGQGYGVTIEAGASLDGETNFFIAFRCDKDRYVGDGQDGTLYII